MAKSHSSTGGPTLQNEEAVWPMTEVGGVRSSVDPAPDLWFEENAGERRGATCSAVRRRSKGLVTALWAISAKNVRELLIPAGAWASAFRVTELGKPDAGKPPVRFDEGREAKAIGYPCLSPLLPAYSTEIRSRDHAEADEKCAILPESPATRTDDEPILSEDASRNSVRPQSAHQRGCESRRCT